MQQQTIGTPGVRFYDGVDFARKSGSAQYYLTFNGSSTFIDCGSDSSLDDLHDAAMTVEAWIYPTVIDASFDAFIEKGTATTGYQLRVHSSEGILGVVRCATTSGITKTGVDVVAINTWYHVAMTWDDASYDYPRLWVGGVEQSNDTTNRVGVVNSEAASSLIIGKRPYVSGFFTGNIAWARISDSIRYTGGFTPPAKDAPPAVDGNVVEQWNLNDGSGTTASAEVNGSNDGTISNGTWGSF